MYPILKTATVDVAKFDIEAICFQVEYFTLSIEYEQVNADTFLQKLSIESDYAERNVFWKDMKIIQFRTSELGWSSDSAPCWIVVDFMVQAKIDPHVHHKLKSNRLHVIEEAPGIGFEIFRDNSINFV